jgi:hypothetical protein
MSAQRKLGRARLTARRDRAADLAAPALPWYVPGRIPHDLVRKAVIEPGSRPILGA